MAGSKNRRFSRFIRQINTDLTVKTTGLVEEARVTTDTVTTQVETEVANLVSSAPAALDTLDELAAALNDDANFATTVTNSIATKANSADLATVATSGSYNDLSSKPSIPSISGLATTSYVDTAVAGAGSSDTVGTETTSGNTITLDYSTGNVFDIDVEGAANNNIIELSNSSSIAKFKVKLNATRAVSGAYGVVGAVQQQTQALSTATGNASYGLTFSPDGTKMFVGGYGFSGNQLGQFNLTTAFDPSTVTSTSPVSIQGYGSAYLAGYGGHCWNSSGTRAYVMIGKSSANYWAAWAINLNTAYDFQGGTNGAAGSGSVGARAFACTLFSSNTFLVYDYAGTVYVKSGSPGGSTVDSRTWTSMGGTGQARDFAVSPDGTKLVAITSNGYLQYFEFATPYDIQNITSLTSYATYTNMGGVAFNDDGTRFFTVTAGNGTARTVYEWEPELTIVDPAISFDTTGGETFVGSVPGLTHNQSSYMELSTIDGGSTYYIITPSSGGGGGGQVLAEYHAVCNGSALGDATTQSVTAVQNLTTTYTDATGSVISGFTVPSGTNKIVYQYNVMIGWVDTHSISHWKLYFSTDGSTWTEVVDARRNASAGYQQDAYQSLSWPFEINAGTADTDSGKLTTTDGDTYYFKWQVREYGVNNEMKLHSTQYWDASGTDQFSMPTVSIKCLS
jgi:hypothetical protein